MTSNPQKQIDELWDRAYQTNKRVEKAALLEEVIRIADFYQYTGISIEARLDLIAATSNRKSLIALAWIFAKIDQDRSLLEEMSAQSVHYLFYWYYICIVNVAISYPEISKEKIWELVRDFLRRIKERGYQYEVMEHRIRMFLHRDFGEIEQAKVAYNAWEKALRENKKDPYVEESDEWDIYTKAHSQYLIFDDIDKALQMGKLIFDGHVTDGRIEVLLPSMLVLDLWEENRLQEAAEFQQRTERQIIERKYYLDMSWHLSYMVLTDQLERALMFFKEYVVKGFYSPWDEEYDPNVEYSFLLHIRVLFHRLQRDGQQKMELRALPSFPIEPLHGDEYAVKQMVDWLNKRLTDLATRFDRRNGNQDYHDDLKKYERWILG